MGKQPKIPTIQIRNVLHNLDQKNPEHFAIYVDLRRRYIEDHEERVYVRYEDDAKPSKVTVGIGFNMDASSARQIWSAALPDVNFDEVYSVDIKKPLTNEQINRLFEKCIEIKESELRRIYKFFDKLRLNERLLIESCYFNAPRLVRGDSNFHKLMSEYYQTGNKKLLELAVYEIEYRSNRTGSRGIENRRIEEAELLSSYKSPFYSNPTGPLLPYKPIKASVASTIIPRGVEHWPKGKNKTHYIWRTKCDDKVRASHLLSEGKIFSYDNPPIYGHPREEYNCRCTAEALPDNIELDTAKSWRNYYLVFCNDEVMNAFQSNIIRKEKWR